MRDGRDAVGNGDKCSPLGTRPRNIGGFPGDMDLIVSVSLMYKNAFWGLTFKPTNGPEHSKNMPKYLAPTFRVEIIMTVPTMVATVQATICQQCSRYRPDDHEIATVAKYANT